MTTEFGDELLDAVAKALYIHDAYGRVPCTWENVNRMTRKHYIGFAQVALQAMYNTSKSDEHFMVCGIMPIEDHPDYKFCSEPVKTLKEAEELRGQWVEQCDDEEATFTVEHSARVVLNILKYWTQKDIEEIDSIAKARAKELAKYVD